MSRFQKRPGILLLNCKSCDDIVRVDDLSRPCHCGKSSVRFDAQGTPELSGQGRLMTIPFEDYDGAIPGETKTWWLL